MALARIAQFDFSGGCFRSLDGGAAPDNTALDIVNGLIETDGSILKRGGSASDLASTVTPPRGIWAAELIPGIRTVRWSSTNFYTQSTGSLVTFATSYEPLPFTRPAGVGDHLVFVSSDGTRLLAYAGSLRSAADYVDPGSATLVEGERAVTGAGTTFTSMDAGSYMSGRVVEAIGSNTSLTLASAVDTAQIAPIAPDVRAVWPVSLRRAGAVCVGSAGGRTLVGVGSQVFFSEETPLSFGENTSFHDFPQGHTVLGIEGAGDSALVFTEGGVYRIDNLAYDAVDAFGNVQQSIRMLNGYVRLWHEAGIASFRGAVVVPAIDGVYLMTPDGQSVSVSDGIRDLYRSYVSAGHRPGFAVVYRDTYVLPILNSSFEPVDVLVCDLGKRAWSRWEFNDGLLSVVLRPSGSASVPIGLTETGKVGALAGCWTPTGSLKNDQDGSTPSFSLRTRPVQGHPFRKVLWKSLRADVQLEDAGSDNPTISAGVDEGASGSANVALSGSLSERTTEDSFTWQVGQRARSMSFVLSSASPVQELRVRGVEAAFRPTGKP